MCHSYSSGLFKVVCAQMRNKAAKPPDWAVLQTLCSGRQWCVHAAPMWADNDDNHYMVTAEDGCSHAPLHLPSIAQPHSTSPHYITCHHSICCYLCLPHYNRRYGISQCWEISFSNLLTICRLILLSRGRCNWWEERGTLHTAAAAGAPFPGPSSEPCPGSN